MPAVDFDPRTADILDITVDGVDVPSVVAVREGVKIRRVADDDPTRFDRAGSLLSEGLLETGSVPMAALVEVFGLAVQATFESAGTDAADAVSVQVTLDAGVTYLAWSGAAWVAQGIGGTYNTLADFNDHCAALTLVNPRSIGFRFKLSPVGDDTPVLRAVRAYVEWKYAPYLDVFDSVQAMLEERFRVQLMRQHKLPQASATFTLNDAYRVDAALPIRVFNLTTDPHRNTNLFQAYNAGTKVVTMTGAQAGASLLQVEFSGSAPVQVSRPDEAVKLSELPKTVAWVEVVEDSDGRDTGIWHDYKLGAETRRVRIRQYPVVREVRINAGHWSANPRDGVTAVDQLAAAFSSSFRLLATGETPQVLESTPGRLDDIRSESYFSGAWTANLRLFFHSNFYEEVAGTKSVEFVIGSARTEWPGDRFSVGG